MKQLSKMMLAAVASVALAAQAFAWDFSASGSSSATFKQATVAPPTGDSTTTANFTSSAGGVTVSSSNSDGANSATFSYTADWNGDDKNFDEHVSVSGSKKVGNWTASSATTQHIQKDATAATGAQPMTGGASAVITLTDGSITYKLGDAAHLSTAEKAVNGPMGGAQDAEANVDSFNGFSVGLGVGPGTLTVALDMHAGAAGVVLGETTAGAATAMACGGQLTGFGLNFSGDVGADLSFTYGSGSAAMSASNCTGDNSSNAFSFSTMGLGVAVPVGGMSIAIDYGSNTSAHTAAGTEAGTAVSGFEFSLTMPVGDATAGVNVSSTSTTPKDGETATTAGTELWYTVPIGAVSLSAGYGSSAIADGITTTEIGAEMSLSF
jgi:hypothetical protein